MKVIIRQPVPDDATFVHEAHGRSIRELCGNDYTPEQIAGWLPDSVTPDYYRENFSNPDKARYYRVAVLGNNVVGFSAYKIRDDKTCWMSLLYVHPDYSRSGVATALFSEMESYARQKDCEKIVLNSSVTARCFYEAMGMSVIKETLHTMNSGVEFEAFEMEKTL